MPEHERLLVVTAEVERLFELYMDIAALNQEFHRACERGELIPNQFAGTA
jgi:hypothetical protein